MNMSETLVNATADFEFELRNLIHAFEAPDLGTMVYWTQLKGLAVIHFPDEAMQAVLDGFEVEIRQYMPDYMADWALLIQFMEVKMYILNRVNDASA